MRFREPRQGARADPASPLRILAAASAMELAFVGAVTSIVALLGARSGWLDVVNSFAPFTLLAAITGGALGLAALRPGVTRKVTLAMALVGIAAGLVPVAPELAGWRPAARSDAATFRVLTSNVWNDNPSPDPAVSAILARDADAVFLQEASGALSNPVQRLRVRYPYESACPTSDLQIWVKAPIVSQSCGLAKGLNGNLVSVTIAMADGRTLTLVTTHLSHPFPPAAQAAEREALAARVRALGPGDVILTGDFNSTPWSYAMKRLDAALTPLRRRTISWFTWPARLDDAQIDWPVPILPIDHIYASPDWGLVRMTRVHIPGSDHFATEAVLVRKPHA